MQLNQIRQAFLGALILVLVLASQSMAQARLMPAAVGQMVICTTDGAKIIGIDAQGQPTGEDHVCPDCVLAFVSLEADGWRLTEPFRVLFAPFVHAELPKFIVHSFRAARLPRAPPVFSDFETL